MAKLTLIILCFLGWVTTAETAIGDGDKKSHPFNNTAGDPHSHLGKEYVFLNLNVKPTVHKTQDSKLDSLQGCHIILDLITENSLVFVTTGTKDTLLFEGYNSLEPLNCELVSVDFLEQMQKELPNITFNRNIDLGPLKYNRNNKVVKGLFAKDDKFCATPNMWVTNGREKLMIEDVFINYTPSEDFEEEPDFTRLCIRVSQIPKSNFYFFVEDLIEHHNIKVTPKHPFDLEATAPNVAR